ncbi:MAG: bifunctional proline dehydrogenase/L-glutamate gamma-semialdehyde dehydrogenase PutA [Alphaproteobacteria bacterium]
MAGLPRPARPGPLRDAIAASRRLDDATALTACLSALDAAASDAERDRAIERRAADLVHGVRQAGRERGLDAFLQEFSLSSREGIALLCIAEALLRIPDADTADRLIRDRITDADWRAHLGGSDSLLVNASTWGLMLGGQILGPDPAAHSLDPWTLLSRMVGQAGEAVVRRALVQAMRILGRQFVMGRTIEEALARGRDSADEGWRWSFDMLGEAARTAADAARYHRSYLAAIAAIGRDVAGRAARQGSSLHERPGISVKLSALHPRFEFSQAERAVPSLVDSVLALAEAARDHGIGLTLDAEESDRLEPMLDVFAGLAEARSLRGWDGLGLAVQAYQKRAPAVLDWLADLAAATARRLPLRLVKGAYWDSEIKWAQEKGVSDYPVYSRKVATDASWLACARRLLDRPTAFYPQFATHNAHAVAWVQASAGGQPFEFQRLHGMGRALYAAVREQAAGAPPPVRVYAPVGSHQDLLPYLVRRLLENGANTSFVHRLTDDDVPVADIVANPVARARALLPDQASHPAIPRPPALYGADRRNAAGLDLTHWPDLEALQRDAVAALSGQWRAAPIIAGTERDGAQEVRHSPADHTRPVGVVVAADDVAVADAIASADGAAADWDGAGADHRADVLEGAADRLEAATGGFMAIIGGEGGRTLGDALAEVREAVDFLRYYAGQSRRDFSDGHRLPGPTGERNQLWLRGRGVFACISPWNFPLAIFTGQIAAALAAGNAVIAKPAGPTPLVAVRLVRLLHDAGVPPEVLHFVPGSGRRIGAALTADPRIAGIAFTGSGHTARAIHRALAARDGAIVPLIAETGGINAMIADSSALAEQVTADVIASAFLSAGQRCSALRLLFLQDDTADGVLAMLAGAMHELVLGDPLRLSTDIGPLIDGAACQEMTDHVARLDRAGKRLAVTPGMAGLSGGSFFAPHLYEIPRMEWLDREVFGPILHVVRYQAGHLDQVVAAINRAGYGLTLGLHSRLDSALRYVRAHARVGNLYVNRPMTGAVVGVQPFGGEGLSGTGPKAGGPFYLHRFATERTVSVNTAATGGNTDLLALGPD